MNIRSKHVYIIYISLYISLLIGFYFNEDFASGYITDYLFHKNVVGFFDTNFSETFLNFDKIERKTFHSPIYIIFFLFLKKLFFNDIFCRLIVLHLSLLIPYYFYLCLKLKYNFKSNDIRIFLPTIIFISPYFRSAAIWLGSENISLIFLSVCFYFFLKYKNSKNKELLYIIINTLFLALAAYMRPIYSLFGIYFFVIYYLDLNFSFKLFFYILTNLILSFPAMYYIFILDVNFFLISTEGWANISRFINLFSITITILLFYSIPILLPNIKKYFQINNFKAKNLILSIIFLYLLIFYFNYDLNFGGGVFYKLSILIFKNNYLFYAFSLLSFNVFILIFFDTIKGKDRILDFSLILILLFLEVDGVFFHETYDPLLYFIFFIFLKNKIYFNFIDKLTNKNFILLVSFSLFFYVLSILK